NDEHLPGTLPRDAPRAPPMDSVVRGPCSRFSHRGRAPGQGCAAGWNGSLLSRQEVYRVSKTRAGSGRDTGRRDNGDSAVMCGIAGLWAPALGPAERRAYVDAMLGRLAHRGPDGAVTWTGNGVTLGLARLAIVAPDHPVTVSVDETETIAAVANAELYNYRELEDRLAAGGHCIGCGPDTTALAHLYEELGVDLPLALDGMFAIAVWDGR